MSASDDNNNDNNSVSEFEEFCSLAKHFVIDSGQFGSFYVQLDYNGIKGGAKKILDSAEYASPGERVNLMILRRNQLLKNTEVYTFLWAGFVLKNIENGEKREHRDVMNMILWEFKNLQIPEYGQEINYEFYSWVRHKTKIFVGIEDVFADFVDGVGEELEWILREFEWAQKIVNLEEKFLVVNSCNDEMGTNSRFFKFVSSIITDPEMSLDEMCRILSQNMKITCNVEENIYILSCTCTLGSTLSSTHSSTHDNTGFQPIEFSANEYGQMKQILYFGDRELGIAESISEPFYRGFVAGKNQYGRVLTEFFRIYAPRGLIRVPEDITSDPGEFFEAQWNNNGTSA